MLQTTPRRPLSRTLFSWTRTLGIAAAALSAPAQQAQPATATQPAAEAQPAGQAEPAPPVLSLDLDRVVYQPETMRIDDKVWQLQAQPGRRLVIVPLRVGPVAETTAFSRSPVGVSKARFIGFFIPPADDLGQRSRTDAVDLSRLVHADDRTFGRLLLGEAIEPEDAPEDATDAQGGAATEPTDTAADDAASDAASTPAGEADTPEIKPVPEGAPRLARSLTFAPDGTVSWGLDRAFAGADLASASDSNLYGYKLSPQALRAAQPERPERIERRDNEDSREFAKRRREQQLQEREAQQAFRDLRTKVLDLPTDFRAPAPPVVYAVFDGADEDEVAYEGDAPLPWTLTAADAERYQQLLQAAPGTVEANELLLALAERVKRDTATARVVAYGVARGGLAGRIEPGDAGDVLLDALARQDDPGARRVALYAAAQADPASPATAELLRSAGERAQGKTRGVIQLAALGALLEVFNAKPQDPESLIAGVNQMLADPQGPGADRVVSRLVSVTTEQRGYGSDPAPSAALVGQVRFDAVPADQQKPVIEAIVANAHANALAAGWLADNLLAQDSTLLDPTLAVLDDKRPAAPEPREDGEDNDTPEPTTLPIQSPDHGLVRALDSDNAQRRKAAWAVLDRFYIKQPTATPGNDANDKPVTAAVLLDLILDKAMRQETTPATVVGFIDNQRDAGLAREAPRRLLGLLASPAVADDVKQAIAQRVLAEDSAYSDALRELDDAQRPDAVAALYRAQGAQAPRVLGLLAEDRGQLLRWLVEQVAEQEALPTPRQWVDKLMEGGRGIETLIEQAASEQPQVAAGAAAALVLATGGNAEEQAAFADEITALDPRDAEAVEKAWSAYRTQVLTRRFADAQGDYRLVVTLREPEQQQRAEGGAAAEGSDQPKPAQRIEVGLVQLRAAGVELSLSVEGVALSAAPDRLAIRIASPASLKTLESAALEDLPLAGLKQPLDLLPTESGVWTGGVELPDGRRMSVSLEPVE